MKSLFFCTCTLLFSSTLSLSAQTPIAIHTSNMGDTTTGLLDFLAQNALSTLLGAVVFMAICWGYFICKECSSLSRTSQKNRHLSSTGILAVVCCTLFGSCTVEQRAMARNYRAAAAAEGEAYQSSYIHENCPALTRYNNGPVVVYNSPNYSPYCWRCNVRMKTFSARPQAPRK